ncbi:MAG TPA: hypothetical protein VFO28_12315, partial [Burkholderiaceae bacterium]|nr:hypothetical protein [Burkholderiaceae bacterium]
MVADFMVGAPSPAISSPAFIAAKASALTSARERVVLSSWASALVVIAAAAANSATVAKVRVSVQAFMEELRWIEGEFTVQLWPCRENVGMQQRVCCVLTFHRLAEGGCASDAARGSDHLSTDRLG